MKRRTVDSVLLVRTYNSLFGEVESLKNAYNALLLLAGRGSYSKPEVQMQF